MLLLLFSSNIQAQNNLARIHKTIFIDHINVQNVSMVNNRLYLSTDDSTFLINEQGEIEDKLFHGINKWRCSDSEDIYSMTIDGKILKSSNVVLDVSEKLKQDKKTAKFLSKSGDSFFSCFVDPTILSYSNGIFQIQSNGYTLFSY